MKIEIKMKGKITFNCRPKGKGGKEMKGERWEIGIGTLALAFPQFNSKIICAHFDVPSNVGREARLLDWQHKCRHHF
jgi:hypothetical protein